MTAAGLHNARRRHRLDLVVFVLAALPVVLWFIWRNALIFTLPNSNPELLIRIWPASEAGLLIRVGQGIPKDQALKATIAASKIAPISGRPFLAAARHIAPGGIASSNAHQLLVAARDRSPWLVPVRLALVNNNVRAKQWRAALDEADMAMRLDPNIGRQMAPTIGALAQTKEAEEHLSRLLARKPPWRPYFLATSVKNSNSTSLVFRALQEFSNTGQGDREGGEQSRIIRDLIARERYDLAYLAFINFLPVDAVEQVRSVYDGSFQSLPGPTPFNWSLHDRPGGRAELTVGTPGLRAISLGFKPEELAVQSLYLQPGNYNLRVRAEENSAVTPGTFIWQLVCTGNRKTIATADGVAAQREVNVLFQVPPTGCKLQTLQLISQPSGDSVPAEIIFQFIDILPSEAS